MGQSQAPGCVILVRESENGRDVRSLGASVHESRCVFPLSRRRYPSVCVPRGMWNEIGAGVKQSLRIASRDCPSQCLDDWEERQFMFELVTFGAGTDRRHDDRDCKFKAPETSEVCCTVHLVDTARLRSLVVGGNLGSRVVVFPIPRVATSGLRKARKDATRRIAMSSGG